MCEFSPLGLRNYLAKLGEARTGLEQFIEAVRTLLEAHELLEEGFGPTNKRTTKTVNRLITLYESWHAAEPNAGCQERADKWRKRLQLIRDAGDEDG